MSQISPTFNAGGGGKTYRIADNLTIDYDAVDELKSIWQNQIAVNKEVMEIVATSPETMELHAKTPFVMDAVAASAPARDAIGTSGVGYDKISAVELAIGKLVAGSAGLPPTDFADISAVVSDSAAFNTVSKSQAAMDALSKSQTAMDTVSKSQTGMNTVANTQSALNTVIDTPTALAEFLASPEVNTTFWSNNTATETFWNHKGDLAESYWELDNDSRHGGQALFLDCDQFPESGGDRISWTIDMTNVNSITVFEKTLEVRFAEFEIFVGGRTEFSADNNNTSYVGRTVDVSDREGNQSLAIGLNGDDGPGRETLVSDIQLN
jgi:hypothetical protein